MASLTIPEKASTALQPSALSLPEGLSFEEWEEVGAFLKTCDGAVQWWIGDWINYGDRAYGDTYAQAIEQTGYEKRTLENMAQVARRIQIPRRRGILTFSHHAAVAYIDPAEQDRLLAKAEADSWSVRMTEEAVRLYKKALKAPEPSENGTPEPPSKVDQLRATRVAQAEASEAEHTAEIVKEYERVENENIRLHQTIDSLQKDDVTTELAKLHDRYARLEGRLQQEMTTRSEAEKEAKYAKGMLGKIRKALGVERDKEIIPALTDLLR